MAHSCRISFALQVGKVQSAVVPKFTCMLVAGEPSGDQLAAELVTELRAQNSGLRFFGAGGPLMASAGVELAFDLTQHSVIGLVEVLRKYWDFRGMLNALLALAIERRPDVIIGVDFGGFNLRFAQALRLAAKGVPEWRPRLVQFVSPQVWASRAGRAQVLAAHHDLLLSILPFEKSWYAAHAPGLRVEFVGHPLVDRHSEDRPRDGERRAQEILEIPPLMVLLPGSRPGELRRHWAVVRDAAIQMAQELPLRVRVVLPNEELAITVRAETKAWPQWEVRVGGLAETLREASIAIASTGTVTLECAWFRVPTLALYRTSWSTYQIGKRIVTVPYLAMPNLLAGELVMPEFIQGEATAEKLARAGLELLRDSERRREISEKLGQVAAQLGEPGACHRAAQHGLELLDGS